MGWLNAIGRALGALAKLAGLAFAWSAGRRGAEARQAKKGLEQARKGHEIDEDVRRLPDADLDDELRGG